MQPSTASTAIQVAEESDRTLRLLVIDDSEMDRQRLVRLCRQAGLRFEPTEVGNIDEMREALAEHDFDIIFIDYLLAGEDGLQAVDIIASDPNQPAASIMIAGEGRIDIAVEAMRRGCSDYVTKSELSVDALQRSIATSLERKMMAATLQEERTRRRELQRAVRTYANACSAEMRSILAATLRRVRKLRDHGTGDAFATDLADVEAHIDRLWASLPTFGDGIKAASDEAPQMPQPQAS